MQKYFKLFVMGLVAMIAACAMTSCDSDDVDDLTGSIWGKTWVSSEGEIYDFYKSFNGVIYSNLEDYKQHKIDKSFVWTITDSRMSFAIDGYRQEDGEWEEVASTDLKPIVYSVTSGSNKFTLQDGEQTLTFIPLAD